MPVAAVVFDKEIELGAQNQIAGVPNDLVVKGLFEAAHQGCTTFTSGSGDVGQYLAVSSQPTPRCALPAPA
jgi:hypothetical protein